MITRRDFVAAVMAAPNDDLVRLAFADWIEEHDDGPRAEFIHAQIELARLSADAPDRPRLAAREAELLAAHAARWTADLPGTTHRGHWRRGFPEHVRFSAQRYRAGVTAYLGREPVSTVELTLNLGHDLPDVDSIAWVERLAADPLVGLVTKLDSGFGPDRFAVLIASPHLTRLREMSLFEDAIGLTGVRALCVSVAADRLRRLDLNGAIGDEFEGGGETPDVLAAVETLAACPRLAGLERLSLLCNGLREASVRALIASQHLSRTLELEFQEDDWELPADLAAALAERFAVV